MDFWAFIQDSKNGLALEEIAFEGEEWFRATGRQPAFNYCIHEGNSTPEDISRLQKIFHPAIWQAAVSCKHGDRQQDLAADFMDLMIMVGYSTATPVGE